MPEARPTPRAVDVAPLRSATQLTLAVGRLRLEHASWIQQHFGN